MSRDGERDGGGAAGAADEERSPADVLDFLTREARTSLEAPREPPVDWSLVEARLFDRVKEEEARARVQAVAAPTTALARRRSARPAVMVLFGLAAAAGVAVAVGRGRSGGSFDRPVVAAHHAPQAGTLREGPAENLLRGESLATGDAIAVGDTLVANGARARFDRGRAGGSGDLTQPGAVAWTLERGGRVTVSSGAPGEPLVLALEEGAVEAEVAPVANGEAFAVDVGDARVAVHGTHLRVARQAGRVVVDLSEGVVSIGPPPRVGSTYGELVTAPAHVEFSPDDIAGTLTVDHAPGAVRSPFALASAEPSAHVAPPATAPEAVALPASQAQQLAQQPPAPRPTARAPLSGAGSHPVPPSSAPPAMTDPNGEGTVGAAVRACLAARPLAPDVVRVMVTSNVELKLADDGAVQLVRFSPPLPPEVQSCAASTIYGVRFGHGGSAAVRVDYER